MCNDIRAAANALLHQIDIGDFVDSNGHSAKMLKATHDLMRALATPNYAFLSGDKDAVKDDGRRFFVELAGEPVAKRIAHGTAIDWWWEKTDCPVGTHLYTEAQALAMHAKGQENMRERAAKECVAYAKTTPFGFMSRGAAMDCRDAIRALPITPTNTEGEPG